MDFTSLQKTVQNNSDYWNRYSDIVNSLSQDQKVFVNKQKKVLMAKEKMYAVFIDYLFEKDKDLFVSCADGFYRPVVDEYIKQIRLAADSYISNEERLEKENQELREQIKILMGANNDTMATNGTRRTGKKNSDSNIRAGNNTREISQNLKLF